MSVTAIRVFNHTILPLLIAGLLVVLGDTARSRERRIELFLVYILGLGVAGSGIGGAFGHLFLSDRVAESIGWPVGSPFQLEMGFANLALGLLGIVAIGRRDGFREATVIAVTTVGVGAAIVHLLDIVQTGNLASGNTTQNISNLLRPALLIWLLRASRRAERSPDSRVGTPAFQKWHRRVARGAAVMTIAVSTGFGIGFALGAPFFGSWVSILVGMALSSYLSQRR